jgi:hypothetical protein
MEMTKEKMAKVRRQEVHVFLDDGQEWIHSICDLAIPSPDGRFFVVRDLTKGEAPGKKGDSVDVFYPTDTIRRIVIYSHQYYLLPTGERGEKIPEGLDKPLEVGQIIT